MIYAHGRANNNGTKAKHWLAITSNNQENTKVFLNPADLYKTIRCCKGMYITLHGLQFWIINNSGWREGRYISYRSKSSCELQQNSFELTTNFLTLNVHKDEHTIQCSRLYYSDWKNPTIKNYMLSLAEHSNQQSNAQQQWPGSRAGAAARLAAQTDA